MEQHMHTTRHTSHSPCTVLLIFHGFIAMWWPYGTEHLSLYSLRQAKKSTSEEAPARHIPLHSHDT